MFERDEYVFHESGGICKIADIQTAPLDNMPADRRYYVMHPLHDQNSVIYIPVDSDCIFLRRLLSRAEAEELLDRIPFVRTIEESNAKLLRAKYQEAMRTHDPVEWVRVIKTVYLRTTAQPPRSGRISETERSFAENAKRNLHAELALALGLSADADMEQYITDHIQKMA
ncbi:MAG: CarD family transcriptional regulator [Clostridia bacterium]|nr:CarD family transcriptional regulator [Clostridia bacterium]